MARRKKKEFNLQARVIAVLRDLSRQWPAKKEARKKAKVKVVVGTYKNGNPKYGTKYQCGECRGLFNQRETHMDHIEPVIEVTGFVDWNTYIARLFSDESNYRCLCKACHGQKTKEENEERRAAKNVPKAKKKLDIL